MVNSTYATVQFDSKLKALFYDKIMFIETAVKNYIAHNSVIFDTRFRKNDPSKAMKLNLKNEIGVNYFHCPPYSYSR